MGDGRDERLDPVPGDDAPPLGADPGRDRVAEVAVGLLRVPPRVLELGDYLLDHTGEGALEAFVPVQLHDAVQAVLGPELLQAGARVVRSDPHEGRPDESAPVGHAVGDHISSSAGRWTSAGPSPRSASPSLSGVVDSARTP